MYRRWEKALCEMIPAVDMIDAAPTGPGKDSYVKRQFAPEFSQAAYETMLSQEYAIGSYITTHGQTLSITAAQRKRMVILIEDLHRHKGYKIDTLMLAVSVADRYLVNLAVENQKAPCLVTLGVTCLLMAAKLEQPMHPSFNIMIRLLADTQGLFVTKQALITLEEKIIRALEFSMHFCSTVPFLERYQLVLGIHNDEEETAQIGDMASKLCRFMQRDEQFLRYRPSQLAAAALILALNLSESIFAKQIGMTPKPDAYEKKGLDFEQTINMEIGGVKAEKQKNVKAVPLKMWDRSME